MASTVLTDPRQMNSLIGQSEIVFDVRRNVLLSSVSEPVC